MYAPDIVTAAALVALVLVFVRISWTLKDIHEAMVSGTAAKPASGIPNGAPTAAAASSPAPAEAGIDENEIAAVIAVAHAALRDAL